MFNIRKNILTLTTAAGLWAGLIGSAGAVATLPPSGLSVVSGDYNGSVNLSWNAPEALAGGKFYIQYSTTNGPWISTGSAQIVITTATIGAQSMRVSGLEYGRNGSDPAFIYYFHVWIENTGIVSAPVTSVSAIPLTPAAPSTGVLALAAGSVLSINSQGGGYGSKLAVDSSGNYYALASMMFSSSTTGTGGTNSSSAIALIKFLPSGAVSWYRAYNSTMSLSGSDWTNDQATAMALGSDGNLIIAGRIDKGANVMLRKYTANGDILWTRLIAADMSSNSRINAISINSSTEIYTAGEKYSGTGNLWLAKFNKDGVQQGANAFYSNAQSGSYAGNGIALYGGYIYVVGTRNVRNNDDIFVEKYGDTWPTVPTQIGAVTAGGPNYDQGKGIKIDASGSIFVTGAYYSSATYNNACWTAKYDSSLVQQWQDLYSYSGNMASGAALELDLTGNAYITGSEYRSDIYQGGNLLLLKYSPGGARLMVRSVDYNKGYEEGYDVKVSSLGVIYAVGSFPNVNMGTSVSSLGIYKLDMTSSSSGLLADKGPFTGSVNLSWLYPAAMPAGSKYYVQYSTFYSVNWSTASAAEFPINAAVSALSAQTHTVGGLQAARGALNNISSPVYAFRVWYYNGTTLTALPNLATAYTNVPTAPTESVITSADGNLLKQLDGTPVMGWTSGPSLARDNAGNAYMLFSANLGVARADNAGIALRKYNPYGTLLWTRFYHGELSATYNASAIAADADGNIIIAGEENAPSLEQGDNIWVSKLDSDGNQIWTRIYDGAGHGDDSVKAVATDVSGNIYVTGKVEGASGSDLVVIKYTAAGSPTAQTYDGGSTDEGTAIDAGADGFVYVTGKSMINASGADPAHYRMIFIKYNSSLAFSSTWTNNPFFYEYRADRDNIPYAVKVSTWGDIYAAGQVYVIGSDLLDAWAARISPAGVITSTSASGAASEFRALTISTATGEVFAAGRQIYPVETLWFQKLNPSDVSYMWSKKFPNIGLTGPISPVNIVIDSRGDFSLSVIISTTVSSQPGSFKFSSPAAAMSAGVTAITGTVPGGAELSWVTGVALPAGTSYYVQASTWNGGWDFALAKQSYPSPYQYQPQAYTEGSLVRIKAGDLTAGRDARGNTTAPYYFNVWYYAGGVSTTTVTGNPSALPNIPVISETSYPYPLGQLYLTTGLNTTSPVKMVRAVSGDIYLAIQTYSSQGDASSSVILKKYNLSGVLQWVRYYFSGNGSGLRALASDASGNVYISGSGRDAAGTNPYIAKYSDAGELLWSRTIPSRGAYEDFSGLTAASDGSIYLTGQYNAVSSGANISSGAALLAKYSQAGVLLASSTYSGSYNSVRAVGITYNAVDGNLYVSGQAGINTSTACFWVGKFDTGLTFVADKKYCPSAPYGYSSGNTIKVDAAGSIYAAGSVYDQYQYDNMFIVKLTPALSEVWSSTYNSPANSYESIQGLAVDTSSGAYVSGYENRSDLNQGYNLFFRKYNTGTGDIVWTNTFNSSGNSYEYADDIAVDSSGFVYVPGSYSYGVNYQYAAGYFKYKQFSTSATNPIITASVKYNGSSTPLKDVNVILLAFNQTGGMDPAGIRVSATDANGRFSAAVPGGLKYFIGLSTPGYVPTVKDQLMDPSGNFYLTLNSDTTREFSLYPRAASDPISTLTVNVSEGLTPGDFLMGEVSVNRTGEKVAYGVLAASAPAGQLQIFNVPSAPAGTYGVALSVPGKNKFLNFFLDTAFPADSVYTVNMSSAISSSGGFDTSGSTVPPSFQGVVRSSPTMVPLEGARIELFINQCSGANTCSKAISYENLTDVNGQFSFYNLPSTSTPYNVNVKKQGSRSWFDMIMISSMPAGANTAAAVAQYREYALFPATYTLTGLIKYNGIPVPNARVMVYGDWATGSGDDSYSGYWDGAMQSDAQVRTGADGLFTAEGLPDGRVRVNMDFMGNWRDLNNGPDGTNGNSDDLKIIISSAGATGPSEPGGNPCLPGANWILDSAGACQSAGLVTFNLTPDSGNTAGTLSGTVIFVTTYTVSAEMPLVVPAESPVTIMATQYCEGGNCQNRQMGFASISGEFTSNATTYSVTLSTGFSYYASVMSGEWGKMSNFNDRVDLTSATTAAMDFTLTRSGALRGAVKMPDGTSFKPVYSVASDDPGYMTASIDVRGVNVQYNSGTGLDEFGNFEFPNLPPGLYNVYLRPQGGAFRWPPAEVENVRVTLGNTTEVKIKLNDGLTVQPQIIGLQALSTATWSYTVLGVPSGFQMNQKNITEMFFEQPQYSFSYDADSASWDKKFMEPGQYDFYLVVGVNYDCGKSVGASCDQFATFIGRVKNVSIQKDPNNANLGTLTQPIPINIKGSLGQAEMKGRVIGDKIFTAGDFEKIFSNFDSEIMGIIPAVMLYDNAGDLRAFTNAMPDAVGLVGFESGLKTRSTTTIINSLADNPLRYMAWGLPPGRYTAVYVNPNYPPVTADVTLPRSGSEETTPFDFDAQKSVVGTIHGVVKSSEAVSSFVGNALVRLKHRTVEKFVVTDSSGAYRFSNLPTGIYRLEVTRDGFVTVGQKTSLAGNDEAEFNFFMRPSESKITGKIYMSKFPAPVTRAGVKIVAYDETMNVEAPSSYLPKMEVQTDDAGYYEVHGVIPGHKYKLSAMFSGKMPEIVDVNDAADGVTVLDDIVLRDIPPQIMVKVRRNADSVNKVNVEIRSPRELISTPVCKYNAGDTYEAASADDTVCASTSAVILTLELGPDNTYLGEFTVSRNQPTYSVCVSAGDNNKMKKVVVYDQVSDAKTEQYIQEEALAGGEISMDKEKEEYSGMELDAGTLSYSTSSVSDVNFQDLVGGFFSALPSVRTVKTAKGNLSIEASLQDLMASEVYNMDLSNADVNKPFTLTLKYDKERVISTGNLRIYQYDEVSGQWKEVPGNYTVDPMSGVIAVDIVNLNFAYEGTGGSNTPLGRKHFKMSAVSNGRYVTRAAPALQTGKFAVFTAKPGSGVAYAGSSYEVYNMPNPFNLKDKNVTISADGGAAIAAGAHTVRGTIIKYHLPAGKSGDLKFVIYNLAGEKVRTIDEGVRTITTGSGEVFYSEWDGKNDTNQDCASGVYFMLTYLDGKKLGNKVHKMAIIK